MTFSPGSARAGSTTKAGREARPSVVTVQGTARLARCDDVDGDHWVDLMEQVHPDLVGPHRTDRLLEVHVALVDRDALVLRGDGLGDVLGRDGAEELALLARAGADRDRSARDEPRGDRLELALARVLAPLVRAPQVLGLLHGALVRPHRDRPRDEVVARVAVGNLDHVAGVSELVDGLLE